MTNTYYIGNNNNEITLSATISAQGLIYSESDNEVPGGASKIIANSGTDTTGTIPKTVIGISSKLDGCKIVIGTIINLSLIDKSLWQPIFDNLSANYEFTGGTHDKVNYGCDSNDKMKSTDGSIITITKYIQLTIK